MRVACVVSSSVIQRLAASYTRGKGGSLLKDKKKKKKEVSNDAISIANFMSSSTPQVSSVNVSAKINDIYGDIFEDVGKYVPIGALDDDATAAVASSSSSSSTAITSTSASGIFDNLTIISKNEKEEKNNERDLMAPVKAVLKAQVLRDQAKESSNSNGKSLQSKLVVEKSENGKAKVHRSVFAANDEVRKTFGAGDAMGHGTYDLYPNEELDSDEGETKDDEKEGENGKRPREVGKGESGVAKKPRSFEKDPGSKSGGGGRGGEEGKNRAQRRLEANKNS